MAKNRYGDPLAKTLLTSLYDSSVGKRHYLKIESGPIFYLKVITNRYAASHGISSFFHIL